MDHELTLAAARKAVAKIIIYKSCGELSLLEAVHELCCLNIGDILPLPLFCRCFNN